MVDLKVAPVGHDAAVCACTRWHYSGCVPSGKLVKFGTWESGQFIGVVLYSRGASQRLCLQYGLAQTEVCEMTRVALTSHRAPVTQIVAESLRLLKATNPGLRLVVSFADPEQGHHGGIYQAGGWVYSGLTERGDEYVVNGKRIHGRSARSLRAAHRNGGQPGSFIEWARKYVDPAAEPVRGSRKHRYLMPLDRGMRRQIARLAQPYPQRVRSVEGDTSGPRSEDAGSTPAARSTTDGAA